MTTDISVPSFDFSAFYYAEILEALIEYKRENLPELTDESIYEASIQILRAFACTGHLNNTLLDMVANENTLPTAKLVESVRNKLRLIDYEMSSATPSIAPLVFQLSKVFAASFELIPSIAQVATERDSDGTIVYFESLEALTIEATDEMSYVLGEEAGTFTDYTTKANSQVTPGDDWTPWATPAMKDAIYWGHKQIMWNKLSHFLTTVLVGTINGVWEYYDDDWRKTVPTSVTDKGSYLEIDLTTLLGTTNRKGTIVRVQLNSTTSYEDVESIWSGGKNIIETVGLLGQTSPSTTVEDYTIGSFWTIIDDVTDGSADFTADGDVEYTLPQTLTKNWVETTIDGKEAYWIRYRIIDATGVTTEPTFQYSRIDLGDQFVYRSGTQGRTFTEVPIGSGTGLPSQTFETSKEDFIIDSDTFTVESVDWTRVSNFLDSSTVAKHYRVLLGENDIGIFQTGGDGLGAVPPVGVGNVSATYRYGAQDDGNVGANTIVVDKTGLTFVSKVWNPRQAIGWAEAQGASEASLERTKITGPATLRIKEVAVGPDDVVELALEWTDANGSKPFSRATAVEEGFGPKTIELIVVASGGGLASTAQLSEMDEYFNGDKFSSPPVEKHIVANQEVQSTNHAQKVIDITATIYGDVTEEQIENALTQLIRPEALKEDGITYEWVFGAEVPVSRINNEIFDIDSSITKVVITLPAADVTLQSRELPILGTVSLTIVTP